MQDPTTIVILRKTRQPIPIIAGDVEHNLKALEDGVKQRLGESKVYVEWAGRIPLKTGYMAQAAILKGLHNTEPYRTNCRDWVFDATGVGGGLVDFLDFYPIRVTLTTGRNVGRDPNGRVSLPKVVMMESLMKSFESFQLQISPKLPDYVEFMKQMSAMQQAFSATGNAMTFNGAGAHDDFCTAAGLALWRLNPAKAGSWWSVEQLVI